MKITKEQLTQIIKEELENIVNEVEVTKGGQFANGVEWDILDNGQICFEQHSEDDYASNNICVPLEELKQILSSPKPRPNSQGMNADAWEFFKKSMPADPEIEKKLKNPFLKGNK